MDFRQFDCELHIDEITPIDYIHKSKMEYIRILTILASALACILY